MIEKEDAKKVAEVLGNNLIGVSHDSNNFQKLPDGFWGYFARGHDKKGTFGIILTYSENEKDVDELIKMYESWVEKNKTKELKKRNKGDMEGLSGLIKILVLQPLRQALGLVPLVKLKSGTANTNVLFFKDRILALVQKQNMSRFDSGLLKIFKNVRKVLARGRCPPRPSDI